MQIPLYFNYEVYTTTRRERDLDAYLNSLSDIVQRHTTAEVCIERDLKLISLLFGIDFRRCFQVFRMCL